MDVASELSSYLRNLAVMSRNVAANNLAVAEKVFAIGERTDSMSEFTDQMSDAFQVMINELESSRKFDALRTATGTIIRTTEVTAMLAAEIVTHAEQLVVRARANAKACKQLSTSLTGLLPLCERYTESLAKS